MKAIDGHEVEFVRRSQWYDNGVVTRDTVIYRWRGRLWRCSEREWKRYTEKKTDERT